MTKPETGHVIWLTGLSGAGKSTIAHHLVSLCLEHKKRPVLLDGDQVRAAIADPNWGFDIASRRRGSYIYGRLAAMLAQQGHLVIVPTISMFAEVRQWNRQHIPGYFEVYLKVTQQVRQQRDPKALYQQHQAGLNQDMAGLDLLFEEPNSPDLIINNNGDSDNIEPVARQILQQFSQVFPNALTEGAC
ncbi:putative adenylyl-sulfate kinase [Alishewanella longhuensis]|uniref:Adenylyl-sulfate kinase n=1 Tax=Alishewanella longhuensis TaxID=1091037 RepID=A0ABQ3KZM1_9ALTE|nr:adenylyl-sulfate kinase [Alishewanella longhuensis]GHG69362.1 putative adenylyl-sulfate kinase [Alishewanella longhuensis]